MTDKMTAEQALEMLADMAHMEAEEYAKAGGGARVESLQSIVRKALTAPRVPEGWKLVPICPSDEQVDQVAYAYPESGLTQYAKGIYQVMVLTAAPEPAIPRPHDDLLGYEKAALAPADDPLTCDTCGTATDNPWHHSSGERRHLHACDKCWPAVNPADKLATLRERVKVLESALESLLYEREAAERRQRASKLLGIGGRKIAQPPGCLSLNKQCTYPDCKCPFDMGADNQCLRGGSDE